MLRPLKVYTASKFAFANMWKNQFQKWRSETGWEIEINARWVNDYADFVPDTAQFCKIGWRHDIEDVKSSDLLMIYGTETDVLRGALVEAGAALAYRKPIIAIGSNPGYGTWKYHELVHLVEDFGQAKILLGLFILDLKQGESRDP